MNRIIDVTPRLGTKRGLEIEAWLSRHGKNITEYAIIDDDSDMLDSQMEHLVLTKGSVGITFKDLEKLNKILKE